MHKYIRLAGWYISEIFHVFPVTVQMVQRPLLTHVKGSAVTAPNGTQLVPARKFHAFLDAPYINSSLQIQPSFSPATTSISLVFLDSSHVSQKSAAHFLCMAPYTCVFCSSILTNHSKSWWFHGTECQTIPSTTEYFFHTEPSTAGLMVSSIVKQQCSHDMPHKSYRGVLL